MIKRLIIANVVVTIFMWILFILLILSAKEKFDVKHPDFIFSKASTYDFYFSVIRFSLASIVPIINLVFVYILLSQYDELKNSIIRRLEEKYELKSELKSNQF